jgi:hypothetical protein
MKDVTNPPGVMQPWLSGKGFSTIWFAFAP